MLYAKLLSLAITPALFSAAPTSNNPTGVPAPYASNDSSSEHRLLSMAGMQFVGMGYCYQHYYAGWDGKGLDNKQDCMDVCRSEPECTHVAFNRGKTCSRYYGDHCTLTSDRDHITYKKV